MKKLNINKTIGREKSKIRDVIQTIKKITNALTYQKLNINKILDNKNIRFVNIINVMQDEKVVNESGEGIKINLDDYSTLLNYKLKPLTK